MSDREALKRRIDELSPMGVRFVARMVDSLADPPQARLPAPEPTWITAEPDWIEYFGLMISAHHGVTVEALGLSSFESAFRGACEAVGWSVDPPGSATRRFVDLTVEAADAEVRKLSLKSTAAQRLSKTSAHVSKLTEFDADGPTIDCAYGGNPAAARVSLDRSDAKITVKQIHISVCDVHAEWDLQP